jgi:hypothetical protein
VLNSDPLQTALFFEDYLVGDGYNKETRRRAVLEALRAPAPPPDLYDIPVTFLRCVLDFSVTSALFLVLSVCMVLLAYHYRQRLGVSKFSLERFRRTSPHHLSAMPVCGVWRWIVCNAKVLFI